MLRCAQRARRTLISSIALALCCLHGDAVAQGAGTSSVEVNVLWPLLPGGISELRYLSPVVNVGRSDPGELVLGVYSDFASRIVRDAEYGKVATLAAKVGYRQHFRTTWHLELSSNLG